VTKRVGILGGGQLGLLLAQSLVRLGCEVSIYEPDADAPACKQTSSAFNGSWTDLSKLEQFFDNCDVVTYEFENVATDLLFALQKKKPLMPSASVLNTTQNRGREKGFMREAGLPHPAYKVVDVSSDLSKAVSSFALPCIAKTTFGGYDGKGQFLLESEVDVQSLCEKVKLQRLELILEEKIELDLEVSCIVGRAKDGTEVVFPVFENQHRDHILDVTLLPANVPQAVQDKVREIAALSTRKLDVVGLLTVEFFLTKTKPRSESTVVVDGWHILINEFAPRPHNSGHITMQACDLSQFDVLARILADVPLKQPTMVNEGSFCMANLLGDVWLEQHSTRSSSGKVEKLTSTTEPLSLQCLEDFPQVIDVVLYGKKEARAKRKMGHFVLSGKNDGKSPNALVSVAHKFRANLCLDMSQRIVHRDS
jgi:5-(carboxyamino)imidazole ribonucleotide synthase